MSPRRTPEEPSSALDSLKKAPAAVWAGAGVVALLLAAGVVLLVSGSSSSSESVSFTGSGYPNIDTANTRDAGKSRIDGATVSNLELAWTASIKGKSTYGSYSSSPVVANGVIYSQDLASNVEAINLKSGDVLWAKSYEAADQGPNGVVVGGGRVYGATPSAAFALDQKTGKQVWSVTLTQNAHEGIDMAPGYRDGLVYVSTVPTTASSAYEGNAVGVLWALDAKTGKKVWSFDTVPKSLWGNRTVNSGGGVWYTPAFDKQGSIYFGVGNPAPFPGTEANPWGSSRPGPNLYTDSIVKLNAKTGKLEWYYQLTPHDLYDWDLETPPILLDTGGRKLVIVAGKSGIVLALDRESGKLVWKRPVGIHNGHDNDGLYAMRGEYSKLKTPAKVYPGALGGVIAPMSTDGKDVFVPVVNNPITIVTPSETKETGPAGGELVALDAASGAVKWKRKLPSPAFGATTVVNDLVFTTSTEGTVFGFDASSGATRWETTLPTGTNTGVTVAGNTLIAPAGFASAEGQIPELVAYGLGGE